MSETIMQFYIEQRERERSIGATACVQDPMVYSQIWEIARRHWGVSVPLESKSLVLDVSPADVYLPIVLNLLKSVNWEPLFGEYIPPTLRTSRFVIRRMRRYEKSDFDEPEYLTIHRWGNWYRIFEYEGVEGGLYKGKVVRAKWASRYGNTNNARSPRFVNDELKQELESAKLTGLEFLPVLWDQPANAKGKFWQITSSITLPRCLLPILEVPEDRQPWTTYDDGGHFPQELVFRQSEVKATEPFDVALTAPDEEIHCGPNSWPRTLVVSQRFRQVIKKLKLTTAELIPSRLVADDWQRPLSDHDRLSFESAL